MFQANNRHIHDVRNRKYSLLNRHSGVSYHGILNLCTSQGRIQEFEEKKGGGASYCPNFPVLHYKKSKFGPK